MAQVTIAARPWSSRSKGWTSSGPSKAAWRFRWPTSAAPPPIPERSREHKGLRAPGTYLPGVITAGTFHIHGERVFWDVHDANKAVVIELADEQYARLIIQVDDPRATVALIESAATRR